jgi:hypothetical protein
VTGGCLLENCCACKLAPLRENVQVQGDGDLQQPIAPFGSDCSITYVCNDMLNLFT